jgi:hypothetical protein
MTCDPRNAQNPRKAGKRSKTIIPLNVTCIGRSTLEPAQNISNELLERGHKSPKSDPQIDEESPPAPQGTPSQTEDNPKGHPAESSMQAYIHTTTSGQLQDGVRREVFSFEIEVGN